MLGDFTFSLSGKLDEFGMFFHAPKNIDLFGTTIIAPETFLGEKDALLKDFNALR